MAEPAVKTSHGEVRQPALPVERGELAAQPQQGGGGAGACEEQVTVVVQSVAEEVPMPLRDVFGPPLADTASWEELHGGWPMVIVQQLRTTLPPGYVAGPKVHAGAQVEIDVAAYDRTDAPDPLAAAEEAGGVATATWVA